MPTDTQHLDFLISQYVDQTLDATDRKSIEQKIASDSIAAALYKDHFDVQELLDDWGNRLPMIDWDAFDRKLAVRLQEVVPGAATPASAWRRWGRVSAAAAALFVAGSIGYTWHALTNQPASPIAVHVAPTNVTTPAQVSVNLLTPTATGPSISSVTYEEPAAVHGGNTVQLSPPMASGSVPGTESAMNTQASGSVVSSHSSPKPDHSDLPPGKF